MENERKDLWSALAFMMAGVGLLLLGVIAGYCAGRETVQKEAIARGFATYAIEHPEPGAFEWRKP